MTKNAIGLSVEGSKKTAGAMDQYLANLHVLYTKLHNYHWNIEGPQFFTLHAKLEELYDAVAEEIDEVAERILMIGERPTASMADYLKKATLKEAPSESIAASAVVSNLKADFETLITDLRGGIAIAQEADDEVSADMMIGSLANYEKTLWMLNAFLAK